MRTVEESAEARPDVQLSVLHRPTHMLVRLCGEIDVATAPELRDRLLPLIRSGVGLVILDLSEVSFCDASGLSVLVGIHLHAGVLGVTLRLTALRPRLAWLLRVNGLDHTLAIYPAPPEGPARGGARGRSRVRTCS
ncbi:MAG: STAS domain-containing protein [Actinoallomurus sp.]